ELLSRERAAIETKVEIARAFDADALHEYRQRESVRKLLRDLARLALEDFRQLQRDRRRKIAHAQLRRRLQHHAFDRMTEEREHARFQGFGELLVNRFEDHAGSTQCVVSFHNFRTQRSPRRRNTVNAALSCARWRDVAIQAPTRCVGPTRIAAPGVTTAGRAEWTAVNARCMRCSTSLCDSPEGHGRSGSATQR